MATQTDHMKLTKPALNESADITVINTNMDTIDQVTSKILPVITGSLNNSGYPIASGEYFEADGNMYKATQAIPTGQAWSSSATQLSSNGIINALNGDIGTLNGKIENKIFTNIYSDYIEGNTPKTYTLPSNATAALVIGNNGNGNTGVHAVSMRNNTEIAATQITSQSPFATFSTSGMTFTVQANYVTRVKVIMF